jgi:predicted component of type VI protein secretion system
LRHPLLIHGTFAGDNEVDMKLSLMITQGKQNGHLIPITKPEFLIGRDPACHLRPASGLISKRHCSLYVRDGKAFVKDLGSTNGTFVNGQKVNGERELRHDEKLTLGPLEFIVKLQVQGMATMATNTPMPAGKLPADAVRQPSSAAPPPPSPRSDDMMDEDSIAEMLLEMSEDSDDKPLVRSPDQIPVGSTIMDIPAVPAAGPISGVYRPPTAPKPADANTQSAAKAILDKYARRNRK